MRSAIGGRVERHPLLAFVLISYGISWSLGIIGFDARVPAPGWMRTAASYLAKFGPSLAGIALVAAVEGLLGVRRLMGGLLAWRVPVRWYAVALLGPLLLWITAATLFFLGRGTVPELELSGWTAILPLFAMRLFVGGGLGEELGWRGYLLPRLQERRKALTASLILGLVWGLWHAPAFLYPASGKTGGPFNLVLFTFFAMALSIIFTWLFNGTRGSVLLAALLHAALNASENAFKTIVPSLQGEATVTIVYGALILATAVVMVALCGPRLLSDASEPPPPSARA